MDRCDDIYDLLGKVVVHFKGGLYKVMDLAHHTETGDILVVYRSLQDCKVYVRPVPMFMSRVDKMKYPDAIQEYRFEVKTDEI